MVILVWLNTRLRHSDGERFVLLALVLRSECHPHRAVCLVEPPGAARDGQRGGLECARSGGDDTLGGDSAVGQECGGDTVLEGGVEGRVRWLAVWCYSGEGAGAGVEADDRVAGRCAVS